MKPGTFMKNKFNWFPLSHGCYYDRNPHKTEGPLYMSMTTIYVTAPNSSTGTALFSA